MMKKKSISILIVLIAISISIFPLYINIIAPLFSENNQEEDNNYPNDDDNQNDEDQIEDMPKYGAEFYVSLVGSDENNGTKGFPFRTLERAKIAIMDLKTTSGLPDDGIVVWIHEGVYELNESLVINSDISGEEGKPVVFKGIPDEHVRLVGAMSINPDEFEIVSDSDDSWDRIDSLAKGNILSINLIENNITNFGQLSIRGFYKTNIAAIELFYNSIPMTLGRWPDKNSNVEGQVNHGFVSIESVVSETSFKYTDERPLRWTETNDTWMHGYWGNMWSDYHLPVQLIDWDNKTIYFKEKPQFGIKSGQPYYAYNLLEEITIPGEWYLDRETGVLYFWPPGPIESSEIYLSMLETPLIFLDETNWVEIQDLIIEMGRTDLIRIKGGNHNRILGCTLRNAGNDAVEISGINNGMEYCDLYNINDRGVLLSGGDRVNLIPANNHIRNCHIFRFSRWCWTYKAAVQIDFASCGNIIAHNHIHDAPHSAILYGGNENTIEYNEIHNVCRFTSDAGAIYSGRQWGWRGNDIQFNFIHHIQSYFEGYGVHGVYMDDCLSGIRVFGNIFYNISGHAIQHGGGRDVIMTNNIMVYCGSGVCADNRGIVRINNIPGDSWNLLEKLSTGGIQYQQDPWAARYPALAAMPNDWTILNDSDTLWLHPEGSIFTHNIGFNDNVFMRETKYNGISVFDKYAEIKDNIENQDPLFVSEETLNFNLNPDSPAFGIPGFISIPFDDIGIQKI